MASGAIMSLENHFRNHIPDFEITETSLKGKLGKVEVEVLHPDFEANVKVSVKGLDKSQYKGLLDLGFIESTKGVLTRFMPASSIVQIKRVISNIAESLKVANVAEEKPEPAPKASSKQKIATASKEASQGIQDKSKKDGDVNKTGVVDANLGNANNEQPKATNSNKQTGAAKPEKTKKLLDKSRIVQEKYGEGYSVEINGVEYRYSSSKLSAQEIKDKVDKLAKGSEGKALQWLKANTVNYYGGKDKRTLTQDQVTSRGAATPVKGAASKGGRAKLVGHVIKSSKKKELKSYTAKGGYATFGFVEPGVELEVVKARDDGYLVVNVKGVAGIKQLQTKMPREVLWEPSNDDVKIEVSQQGQAMPKAEKDPKPQENDEFANQLKRIEKFADTQVKELDKDDAWTFRYIDDPQDMAKYNMDVPGLILFTGYVNKDNSELNDHPVVRKFNKAKKLKRYRNWFSTLLDGMPSKAIIFIDAEAARSKGIKSLKEAFGNISFFSDDVVIINEQAYVFDVVDNQVTLVNEQEEIVIML